MKGKNIFFDGYNKAGSSDVRIVIAEEVIEIDGDSHVRIPYNGEPNSVFVVRKNGTSFQERYYDENGLPYLDIDYSDHGNPKQHPIVPHMHLWHESSSGERRRDRKGNKIK